MRTPPPPPTKERQGKQHNIPNPLEDIGDVTKWGLRGCARFGSLGCLVLLFVLCCIISAVSSPFFDGAAIIINAVELFSRIIGRNLMDVLPDLMSIILSLAGAGGFVGAFFTFACLASPCLIGIFLIFVGAWLPDLIKTNATGRQQNNGGGEKLPPPPRH